LRALARESACTIGLLFGIMLAILIHNSIRQQNTCSKRKQGHQHQKTGGLFANIFSSRTDRKESHDFSINPFYFKSYVIHGI